MSRVLVIGAAGFLGRHLAETLAAEQWLVIGAGRREAPDAWPYGWLSCDLCSTPSVLDALARAAPDLIVNAADTHHDDFDALLAVHVAGTARLLDSVRGSGSSVRVVAIGSAAEYGRVEADQIPVDEAVPPRPVSPYGIAKAAQTLVALRPGVDAVVARIFNVCGPGEPRSLVCGAFASQIAELERTGHGGTIGVGDLTAQRDFIDVRDAARAVLAIAERGQPGEAYNVCSGIATSIRDVFDLLCAKAGVPIEPRLEEGRAARPDVPRMVGSPAKLAAVTGWTSAISLDRTLDDLLASYRRA